MHVTMNILRYQIKSIAPPPPPPYSRNKNRKNSRDLVKKKIRPLKGFLLSEILILKT